MNDLVAWWLSIELVGLIALPPAFLLFRNLADRGYAFSKVLGLLLVSYLLWISARSGLLPNSRGSIVLLIALLAMTSLIIIGRVREEFVQFLRDRLRLIVHVELIFLVALLLGALIRALNPAIAYTEKPMEFAFLNGILRSEHFPPVDPWLSSQSISYYYFGYVMIAVLTQLSGVVPAVAFNLALALLFALTTIGAYGLVFNLAARFDIGGGRKDLSKAAHFALVGPLLVLLVGNLEGILELIHAHGQGSLDFWRWVGIDGLSKPYQSLAWYPSEQGWWWWRATRLINTFIDGRGVDYTIEEFPFFSFRLGDMHPHVLALPLGLLALALGLQVLSSVMRPDVNGKPVSKEMGANLNEATSGPRFLLGFPWWFVIFAMLILGSLGFANSWDFPTYFFVILLAVGLVQYARRPRLDWYLVRTVAMFAAMVGLGSILLYLPFYTEFRSQASGVVPVSSPGTRPLHYLLFWGLLLFLFLSLAVAELWRPAARQVRPMLRWSLLAAFLPVALWLVGLRVKAAVVTQTDPFDLNLWRVLVLPLTLTVVLYVGFRLAHALGLQSVRQKAKVEVPAAVETGGRREETGSADQEATSDGGRISEPKDVSAPRSLEQSLTVLFAVVLGFVALLLTLGAELFYIQDVFSSRMNTVFKFYYQAWLLLAIASSFALYYWHSRWALPSGRQFHRYGWWVALLLLLGSSLIYPAAVLNYDVDARGTMTLDGLAFLRSSSPDEYEAVIWLQQHVTGTPTILEAPGERQYAEFSMASSRTGLPTVIGWIGHENQWRGSDALYRDRKGDVDQIYSTADTAVAKALLRRYDVKYIFVGPVERARYGVSPTDKFAKLGAVVFQNKGVTIYAVGG